MHVGDVGWHPLAMGYVEMLPAWNIAWKPFERVVEVGWERVCARA